jgi:ABC-type amino acid transport system permease subunit
MVVSVVVEVVALAKTSAIFLVISLAEEEAVAEAVSVDTFQQFAKLIPVLPFHVEHQCWPRIKHSCVVSLV